MRLETRIMYLMRLANGEVTVTEIADVLAEPEVRVQEVLTSIVTPGHVAHRPRRDGVTVWSITPIGLEVLGDALDLLEEEGYVK